MFIGTSLGLTQGLRPYGSAFSPLSLFAASEQGVWYDPSDFSSMFQDSAGTTPVTATGQPVGKINDKSGRGNHATQATAAARPVLQQDAGGKYYLAFDGVDDAMATASIDFTATDKITMYAGIRKNTDAAQIALELSTNAAVALRAFYFLAGTDSAITGYQSLSTGNAGAGATQIGYNSITGADTSVITATHDIAGSLTRHRRNGAVGTDGTGSKGTGTFGNYPLFIGARNNGSFFLNGRLYSIIVRGALSTAGEITNTENYVNGKTGAF